MRILHAYAGPFPSHQGTQVYLRGLLGAQAARGHDVSLRCWAGGVGPSPEGVEIRRLPPLPGSFNLRSGPSVARGPLALAMALALQRDLRERWDALHLHHVEAPLLAPRGAAPRVHYLHTELREELPDYARGPMLRRSMRGVGAWLDRRCARGADLILALSEEGAAVARAAGAREVTWIPPGVEPMRPALPLGDRDSSWVLYLGNLDRYQEVDLLLREVARTGLSLRVCTGCDPTPLSRVAQSMGIPPQRLDLRRCRSLESAKAAIDISALGVVPRRECAGFPMKVLPFLAMGRPVVGWAGAVPDLPGIVAVRGEENELGEWLSGLVADPERARRIGAEGRAHARSSLRWGQIARALDLAVAHLP